MSPEKDQYSVLARTLRLYGIVMKTVWEYRVMAEPNFVALERRLCDAGLDGWEAVSLALGHEWQSVIVLKRRLIAEAGEEEGTRPAHETPTDRGTAPRR
jgi:hypothetical protein